MKSLIAAALLLTPAFAQAADLVPANKAHAVRINAVTATFEGEHGWPMTRVKATATFGNSCVVPKPSELTVISQYTDSYTSLALTLASSSNRACPAVYAPVTVTIDLGTYVKPNDGLFSTISVNGVEAPAL